MSTDGDGVGVGVAELIVRTAERDVPLRVAVTVAFVVAETCVVLTVKLADEAPAATVTLDGTVAAALLLDSRTVVAAWAFMFNVTIPVEVVPPVAELGFMVKDKSAAGAGCVPVVFIRTFRELPAPLTPKAMSGLPSPLKSLEVMKMLPSLVTAVGLRYCTGG